MKCLIIAAGKGTRLRSIGNSKPLVKLLGKPLIQHVIENVKSTGITDFHVITGYNAALLTDFLTELSEELNVNVNFIHNDDWEKPNGLSVLKAKEHIKENFILLMSDHMFDPSIVVNLMNQPISDDEAILSVDFNIKNNPLVDLDDVTKAYTSNGHIINIGKTINRYNAFDTGIFMCSPAIFPALEKSISDKNDYSLSGGMKSLAEKRNFRYFDIGDKFWIDIDDEASYIKAKNYLSNIVDVKVV